MEGQATVALSEVGELELWRDTHHFRRRFTELAFPLGGEQDAKLSCIQDDRMAESARRQESF